MTAVTLPQAKRDERGKSAAIVLDLCNAFYLINHDLLIAKLHTYGLRGTSMKLLKDYLSNGFQRTKVNGTLQGMGRIFNWLLQGSVLGPLLFNIYLIDVFYMIERTEICNFANDKTLICMKQ